MYVMQGIPGSGKSTVARLIRDAILHECGAATDNTASIRSTDDQFMVEGKYVFDQSKIGGYHQKNAWRVERDCQDGINYIIVDNTNIKARDAKAYIALAKKYEYSITVIRVDAGLNEAKKRNATRTADRMIPEHVIERMHGDMENIRLDDKPANNI